MNTSERESQQEVNRQVEELIRNLDNMTRQYYTTNRIFNIPPGATVTGIEAEYNVDMDRIYRTYPVPLPTRAELTTPFTPIPQPPNKNQYLCAKRMDANGAMITLSLLTKAYIECVPQNIMTEPDQIWANGRIYSSIVDLITSQPGYTRYIENGTLDEIRCMNAIVYTHYTIPRDEVIVFNSRYPEHSMRIVNLYTDNPIWRPLL